MKILVAVDGSAYTKRMLAYIAAHDEWLGSHHRYTVIHCVLPLPHRAAAFANLAQARAFYKEDAEAVLAPIRTFLAKQGIDAAFMHRIGAPAAAIAKVAQQGKFDLLVIGSQGRGAVSGLVLGSVATTVLSLCDTPVLLIR